MFSRLYTAGGVAGGRHTRAPSMDVGTEDRDDENRPRGKCRPHNRRRDGDHDRDPDHDASCGGSATTAPMSRGASSTTTSTKKKMTKKARDVPGGQMGRGGTNASGGERKGGTTNGDVVASRRIGKVGMSSSSSSAGMGGGGVRHKAGSGAAPGRGKQKMTSLNRRSAAKSSSPKKETTSTTATTTSSPGRRFFRGFQVSSSSGGRGTNATSSMAIRTRTEGDLRARRRAPDVTVLCEAIAPREDGGYAYNEDDDDDENGCSERVGVECKFEREYDSSATNVAGGGRRADVVDDGPSHAVYARRYALTTIEGGPVTMSRGGEEEGRIALPPARTGRGGGRGRGRDVGRTTDSVECDDSSDSSSASEDEDDPAGARLGMAGWHRALSSIVAPAAVDWGRNSPSAPRSKSFSSSSQTTTANATLDHLAVTLFLKNSCPSSTGDSEYDAIAQEYAHLLREAKCLECDRLELERMYNAEARRARRTERDRNDNDDGEEKTMTYRNFRTYLREGYRGHGVDHRRLVSSFPVTWLEDALLLEGTTKEDGGRRKIERRRSFNIPFSKRRLRMMRDFRGTGLALIFADPVCEASILENYRHGDVASIRNATLIDNGGKHLTHCAITGLDKITREDGTSEYDASFFLKFDVSDGHSRMRSQRLAGAGGVNHLLPPNLVERLIREGRNRASIRYLSTGASYALGISLDGRRVPEQGEGCHRCYYVEFDDGECWWGTNGDDVLDRIFTKMDVHRVAFGGGNGDGSKSSWIVIGKNGSVTWRNVPWGLHNFLLALKSAAVAPVGKTAATKTKTKAVICPPSVDPAPCEVSLGMNGTYFVRLLDGSVDYSLPNFVAEVIDKLETDGKQIVNVTLHVDTFDCFVRYSLRREG
jgi:hypothetical protein